MLNMLRPYPARERRAGLDMTDVFDQPTLRRDCNEMIKVRATDSSLLLEPTKALHLKAIAITFVRLWN